MSKPGIPKGTRDFGPDKMVKRNYIFDTIRRTFQSYGFLPLETPAMENLSVLMGKYGEEGDQLLFKILNSGNFSEGLTEGDLQAGYKRLTSQISEKGLRYDLTVPFARYVVMHRNDIVFPFKRYQIQPVWRADRPQKGRYREFYQCDADVVGTHSLLCEAEIVLMMCDVMNELGLTDFTIKINHRNILRKLYEALGAEGSEIDMLVAIDKLDKIGREGVENELSLRGFSAEMINTLFSLLAIDGTFDQKLGKLETGIRDALENAKLEEPTSTNIAAAFKTVIGFENLKEVLKYLRAFGFTQFDKLDFDVTLARGLSYYTGCIFEIKINNVQIGSVSGGGRYDNLTGAFGMPGVSGVGFSFGVDRIYDAMEELNLFPGTNRTTTQLMFTNFDMEAGLYALPLLRKVREAGIHAEMYPDAGKLKKQLDYANQKNIPYVVLIGSEEIQTGKLTMKNMQSGEQQRLTLDEIIAILEK